jgi:hypothetical protein
MPAPQQTAPEAPANPAALNENPPVPVTEIPWKSVSPDVPAGAITDNGVNMGSSRVEGGSPRVEPTPVQAETPKPVITPLSDGTGSSAGQKAA